MDKSDTADNEEFDITNNSGFIAKEYENLIPVKYVTH